MSNLLSPPQSNPMRLLLACRQTSSSTSFTTSTTVSMRGSSWSWPTKRDRTFHNSTCSCTSVWMGKEPEVKCTARGCLLVPTEYRALLGLLEVCPLFTLTSLGFAIRPAVMEWRWLTAATEWWWSLFRTTGSSWQGKARPTVWNRLILVFRR